MIEPGNGSTETGGPIGFVDSVAVGPVPFVADEDDVPVQQRIPQLDEGQVSAPSRRIRSLLLTFDWTPSAAVAVEAVVLVRLTLTHNWRRRTRAGVQANVVGNAFGIRSDDVLAMFCPASTSPNECLDRIAYSTQANGMTLSMAVVVGAQITYNQKGLASLLRLEAPDLDCLDEVPTISYDDRCDVYPPELRKMADKIEVDGRRFSNSSSK
ncbi:MAG: hypothetical protein AAGA48_34565 [Myxococcota bacterium]